MPRNSEQKMKQSLVEELRAFADMVERPATQLVSVNEFILTAPVSEVQSDGMYKNFAHDGRRGIKLDAVVYDPTKDKRHE